MAEFPSNGRGAARLQLSIAEIIAIIIGILLVITPMTALTRSIFLLIVLFLSVHLVWRTTSRKTLRNALCAILPIVYAVIVVVLFASEQKQAAVVQNVPTPTPVTSRSPLFSPSPSGTPSPLPKPSPSPTSQVVRVNPSASPILVPSGFTAKPESAQLEIEGGKRQNVLTMLQAQEKYRGPGSVLQFEVILINSEGLYAGGENVSDKTGLPITDSRYWQQVDISDLYFYMQKTGRVAITFVWLKPIMSPQ